MTVDILSSFAMVIIDPSLQHIPPPWLTCLHWCMLYPFYPPLHVTEALGTKWVTGNRKLNTMAGIKAGITMNVCSNRTWQCLSSSHLSSWYHLPLSHPLWLSPPSTLLFTFLCQSLPSPHLIPIFALPPVCPSATDTVWHRGDKTSI